MNAVLLDGTSARAARQLTDLGYTRCYFLEGGADGYAGVPAR